MTVRREQGLTLRWTVPGLGQGLAVRSAAPLLCAWMKGRWHSWESRLQALWGPCWGRGLGKALLAPCRVLGSGWSQALEACKPGADCQVGSEGGPLWSEAAPRPSCSKAPGPGWLANRGAFSLEQEGAELWFHSCQEIAPSAPSLALPEPGEPSWRAARGRRLRGGSAHAALGRGHPRRGGGPGSCGAQDQR